jgi:hypothetical protein
MKLHYVTKYRVLFPYQHIVHDIDFEGTPEEWEIVRKKLPQISIG